MRNRILFICLAALLGGADVVHAACVTSTRLNLRTGPGKQFPVSWVVGQYMPLKTLGSKSGWVEVQDIDGARHWTTPGGLSETVACVVIKAPIANLRQGPGAQYPPSSLVTADKYTPFKKVDREGGWIQLEDDHKERFWVYETNVWFPVKRAVLSF